MTAQVTIDSDYVYPMMVAIAAVFVSMWAGFKVGKARKEYNIQYPQMYAEQSDKNANAFNCVQRAHQNLLENLPIFFVLLAMSSVFRPMWAAIASLVRLLGFIQYVRGYSTGNPKARMRGAFGYLGVLATLGLIVEAMYKIYF